MSILFEMTQAFKDKLETQGVVFEGSYMTAPIDLKRYVSNQIKKLVHRFDTIEFTALVDDHSYSIDFFVINKNEKKKSCLDMIDDGIINSKEYDIFARTMAQYIRKANYYNNGEVNKYKCEIT